MLAQYAEHQRKLRATYTKGRVENNIYFDPVKCRFRVKVGAVWLGSYHTLEGARLDRLCYTAQLANNKEEFGKGFVQGDVSLNWRTGLFEVEVHGKTKTFLHIREARKQARKLNKHN